jgi:hypothetical protein
MSAKNSLVFPDLVYLNDYSGVFDEYFQAVYQIFERDFIRNPPAYEGTKVSAQRQPLVDGIHRTFYHITHEGEDENNRTPDIRRMERIRFPRFIISSAPHNQLLVWKNQRGRDTRILIWNEEEEYLVVLTERPRYLLFWTAYQVTQKHSKEKLIREYKAYIKAKTAQQN